MSVQSLWPAGLRFSPGWWIIHSASSDSTFLVCFISQGTGIQNLYRHRLMNTLNSPQSQPSPANDTVKSTWIHCSHHSHTRFPEVLLIFKHDHSTVTQNDVHRVVGKGCIVSSCSFLSLMGKRELLAKRFQNWGPRTEPWRQHQGLWSLHLL